MLDCLKETTVVSVQLICPFSIEWKLELKINYPLKGDLTEMIIDELMENLNAFNTNVSKTFIGNRRIDFTRFRLYSRTFSI